MQINNNQIFNCVPATTPTNPLFNKISILKLNDVYKMQIFKLICSTLIGLNVITINLHLPVCLLTQDKVFKEIMFCN